MVHETPCPQGTVHNPMGSWDKACDHPRNVPSCTNGQTSAPVDSSTKTSPNQPPTQNTNVNPYIFPNTNTNTNRYPVVNPFGAPNQLPGLFYPRFGSWFLNNNIRRY